MEYQEKDSLKEKNLQKQAKKVKERNRKNSLAPKIKEEAGRKAGTPNAETLDKYNKISSWLISGFSRREAKEKAAEEFGISEWSARELVNKAVEYYRYQDLLERDSMLQLLLGRWDELYSAACGDKEYAAANKALEMIAKLFNLFDNKLDVNLKGDFTFEFGAKLNNSEDEM